MSNATWPFRKDSPRDWTREEIEQTIAALRGYGTMNTPAAYYVAEMLQQLLAQVLQLASENDRLRGDTRNAST